MWSMHTLDGQSESAVQGAPAIVPASQTGLATVGVVSQHASAVWVESTSAGLLTGCPVSNPALVLSTQTAEACCDTTPTVANPVCEAGTMAGAPCTADSDCPSSVCIDHIPLVCGSPGCTDLPLTPVVSGRFVPYVVNFADASGCTAAGNVKGTGIWDNGISHQSDPDVQPAGATVPQCNPVPTVTPTPTVTAT